MFGKSLVQLSVSGRGCVPSWLLDLRPICGGGKEDNGNLLQKRNLIKMVGAGAAVRRYPMPKDNGEVPARQ